MNKVLTIIIICSISIQSCNFLKKDNDKKEDGENIILARVFEESLYLEDLPENLRDNPGRDSARVISSFVKAWVKKQLILNKAKEEISPDDKEIAEKIESYSNFLLIQKFKDNYIRNHHDSAYTEEEMEAFYENEINNFLSPETVYKGTFLKIPSNVPGISKIRKLILKGSSDQEIKSFCIRYARNYFVNTWFPESTIYQEVALKGLEKDLELKTLLEKADAEYVYLIFISEKVEKGEPAPLEYIKSDVSNLLINKKHLDAIKNLENEIYKEGKESGEVEIF